MKWLGACLSAALFATQAMAQNSAEAVLEARIQLETAAQSLADAESSGSRVQALTSTIRAYEQGLTAMRDGIRDAARQQDALKAHLRARDGDMGALLAALQTMSRTPMPARLVHPEGPVASVRAGILLSDIAPVLQSEIADLQSSMQEIHDLRLLQAQSTRTLSEGLEGAQAARTALNQAILDRNDLPRRFTEDAIQRAVMIAATETLDGFATALSTLNQDMAGIPVPESDVPYGALPLPVPGEVVSGAGEADATGITRPGMTVGTIASALVTTPVPATIRFAGALHDQGMVSILEPRAGTLLIFAGMAQAFGEAGQVLPAGDPVGIMGRASQSGDGAGEGGGNMRSETLYIEIREKNETIDPETWFRTGRE